MKRLITTGAAFLLAATLSACNGNNTSETQGDRTEQAETMQADLFSADSAYTFVQRQVNFGPRIPGTAPHRACGDWLVATLRSFGAAVQEQTAEIKAHDGTMLPMRNIIAGSFQKTSSWIH